MTAAKNYALITTAYWGFTLTDGALRMLVLLHFHQLGYSPLELASLFLLYEICGIFTNLFGGWVGGRLGLNMTLYLGLSLQIMALLALSLLNPDWSQALSVTYVVLTQGLSGIAKDFTKISAKSSVKGLVAANAHSRLFRWVAILTGSKNMLKGIGFFAGGVLLTSFGFAPSLWMMALILTILLALCAASLPLQAESAAPKVKITSLLSKSADINYLSAARMMLFGARDVWFVVALPLFLYDGLQWSFHQVGGFMALWVIGYGLMQGVTPAFVARSADGRSTEVMAARLGITLLAAIPLCMGLLYLYSPLPKEMIVLPGLILFGLVFAVNSSVHSYLILALSRSAHVSVDVGFYYMANAAGRLMGTLLSGLCYQQGGIVAALGASAVILVVGGLFSFALPRTAKLSPS